MAKYDLRHIQCARYVNTDGVITFTDKQPVGDAMIANIEFRYAEGRLYAESTLAEYIRKCSGGTISLGVKYIKQSAQKLMYGLTEKVRSVVPSGGSATNITSLVTKRNSIGNYVGVSFYSPARYDGVDKFDCIFIGKAMFGEPSMNLQTAGENIQFATPTTSGEFLADNSDDGQIIETAVVDTEALALAWCDAVFESEAPTPTPSVTLDLDDIEMTVGGSDVTLTATTVPAGETVTWLSSDSEVATVEAGVVSPVAAGDAVIIALITVDGASYSATCSVTVSQGE